MHSLSDLWRISSIYYRNLAFLSLLEMRRGQLSEEAVEKLSRNSYMSLQLNKVFLTLMFVAMAVFASFNPSISGIGAYLLLLLFLFTLFFLQSMTTFLSLNFDILKTLPLSERERKLVVFFTFVRIFDFPLIANFLIFPAVSLLVISPISAIPALLGSLSSEFFAISLVVYLSRAFYRRISRPASKLGYILRFLYQILWVSVIFLLYAFMMWLPSIYRFIEGYEPILERYALFFSLLYPFNFATSMLRPDAPSILSSILFFILSLLSLRWAIRNLEGFDVISPAEEVEWRFKPTGPLRGMIIKDLRVITRNPAMLTLALLPVFEGLFLSMLQSLELFAFSMVATFAFVFLYTLHTNESRTLVRVLPITAAFLRMSKILLSLAIFAISILVLALSYNLQGRAVNYLIFSYFLLAWVPSSIFVLRVGEKLGISRNVGLNTFGFIILVLVGNSSLFFPLLFLAGWMPFGPILFSMVVGLEYGVSLLLLSGEE